ncbi:MAG: hypothetical protein MNPFHGCM_00882 [Gemmatimonadaceae bacterium]|nr:hypothetical protein [Gemmatimonadaceae bacterium]
MKHCQFVVLAIVALPLAVEASAQTLPVRIVRRGAATLEVTASEPISFFIEHSKDLELTDAQRDTLMALRRRLRAQNAPYVKSLDSLRGVVGLEVEPSPRANEKEREKLDRFQKLSAPFADSIRANNDVARGEAWTWLEPSQRTRVDSILKAERDARLREQAGQPRRRPSA